MDTRDELLARILDAAARKKRKFRRATRVIRTRVAWCMEADGGIFEHLSVLRTVTDLSINP